MNFIWGIGLLVASFFVTSLITPAVETPAPSGLDDFDFPQVDEGTPQVVVFGDVWLDDWFVIWWGNLRTSAIKADSAKK